MIKAVVFDLDDTLISEKQYVLSGFKAVSSEIAGRYGLDSSKVFNKMKELFEDSSKEVFNRVLDLFHIDYSNEDIKGLIDIYRSHNPDINFYDDVIPTLTELKRNGIKLGIITDGYKETQYRKLEALRCSELFDEIIITDELGREYWKPHEKPYKMMAERLGIELNEMIYVGDNVAKDFITANKLNIFTAYIERKNGVYNQGNIENGYSSKCNIHDLNELNSFI